MRTDAVVIGGGAIRVAVAYFLRHMDPSVGVVVVELDSEIHGRLDPEGVGRRPATVLLA